MNYPETFDEYPMRINAQAIRDTVAKYGEDEEVATVAIAIAGYANGKGVAFPGVDLIADEIDFTVQEVSCYAHRAAAIGIFAMRKVKAKGAKYAHNVYTFAKNLIRKTSDIRSSHFIANVKKWRAEGRDVAQAIKKRARKSIDDLTAKAEKMAQLFQDRPDLMDDPERAAQLAGVADNPNVSDVMPQPVEPVEWENGATWDAPAETLPAPKMDHTATLAALFGISAPVDVKPVKTDPNTLDDSPLPLYMQNTDKPAAHSWRRHVPGYEEKATV